jgi:hypothetical protein
MAPMSRTTKRSKTKSEPRPEAPRVKHPIRTAMRGKPPKRGFFHLGRFTTGRKLVVDVD